MQNYIPLNKQFFDKIILIILNLLFNKKKILLFFINTKIYFTTLLPFISINLTSEILNFYFL